MKIKLDFISNSSSTSFVYISDKELTEEAFFTAVGVDKNGPVGDLFYQMFIEIKASLDSCGKMVSTKGEAESYASHEFTPDVIARMQDAIEQGKVVMTSSLSSDGSLAESLLCTSIFEIESDQFYINAYNNVW
ncbi:hypothetical protein [Plesiomonas shigelloides]|uniref:hypothetical protein n=1 Tax=Plesiomonas shigelloides TaxID=703 RepID=UPI00387F1B15